MIKLYLKYGLPFADIKINHNGKEMVLNNILIDTGSAGTILKMDKVDEIGITIEENDNIETISGIGGKEFVYLKIIDKLIVGNFEINKFEVEIGVMEYGFDINGIIGINFLRKVEAVVDLGLLEIR